MPVFEDHQDDDALKTAVIVGEGSIGERATNIFFNDTKIDTNLAEDDVDHPLTVD